MVAVELLNGYWMHVILTLSHSLYLPTYILGSVISAQVSFESLAV